jgi:hypothetical protein
LQIPSDIVVGVINDSIDRATIVERLLVVIAAVTSFFYKIIRPLFA